MSRATVLSTEMEAFLYSVPVAAEATMESSNSPTDATTPYADFDAQTAYELLEDDEDDDDDVSDDEGGESSAAPSASVLGSVADFLVSLSLPFLLESFFGGVYFIRTLLLGHALHFVMHFLSVTEQAVARWLGPTDTGNAISSIKGGGGGGAGSSAAWPPPTLIGLGVLTIFALIVHPDGYTWIMLRKIRYVAAA